MITDNFKNKKVLVAGVGKYPQGSLNSAIRFFAEKGARVTVTDAKPARRLKDGLKHIKGLRVSYRLGKLNKKDFTNADIVIKAQGNREQEPFLRAASRAGIHVTTDVGLFMLLAPDVPTVGITGTRGKSTTTALVGEMINADGVAGYVGGNMKVSPLNFLKNVWRDYDRGRRSAVVLELSSWLLEGWNEEGISPSIAVVTNIFPDHLNTYPSYAAYRRAKAEIFLSQGADDRVVLNRDNGETRNLAKLAVGKVYWFSKHPFSGRGACVKKGAIKFKDTKEETVARISDIKFLQGAHNLENILAAVVAAKLVGVKNKTIAKVLRSFRGLPDRQELIRVRDGVRYVNDTTATSPDGAVAALNTFGSLRKNIVLIAGGKDKELDFRGMAKAIKKTVKSLILFDGTASVKIMRALKRLGVKYDLAPVVNDMRMAVKIASDVAAKGDVVLLSPGAASFGLFKNEFDRGEQFNKAVAKLCPVEQLRSHLRRKIR